MGTDSGIKHVLSIDCAGQHMQEDQNSETETLILIIIRPEK